MSYAYPTPLGNVKDYGAEPAYDNPRGLLTALQQEASALLELVCDLGGGVDSLRERLIGPRPPEGATTNAKGFSDPMCYADDVIQKLASARTVIVYAKSNIDALHAALN